MKLTIGTPAPKFDTRDVSGAKVCLDDLKGKFTILSFHRYVGCPLCNMAVRGMQTKSPSVLKAGLSIISIFESGDTNLKAALTTWGTFDFPVVADPQAKLFAQYGVETSLVGFMGTARRMGMAMESYKVGFPKIKKDGSELRMPASFFIGPDLKVFDLHYGRDPGDHLTPAMMEKWLRVAASA